jgi:MFS family permease
VVPRVPASLWSLLATLRFQGREAEPISLRDAEWREALDLCGRLQITLVVARALGDRAPEWVRQRLARNIADNSLRLDQTQALEKQVGEWLGAAGIDFVVLKGTTQWPHFVSDLRLRNQGDLDIYCAPQDARRAWDLFREHGYEVIDGGGDHPTDHLPTLIRKTGWEWHGNEFDPEMPLAIEVHSRFWDEGTERLRAPGVEQFWERRQGHALDTPDALAYAALHLLRHLLRGSARPYHVYEIAWFLEQHAADTVFWRRWQALHAAELRQLTAVAFLLARYWFGCELGAVANEEVARLPTAVHDWFEAFAFSPLEAPFRPNKDELLLHLALLDSARDKVAVVRRRLFPGQLPGPVDAACIPAAHLTLRRRVLKNARYLRFMAGRIVFHARALLPLMRNAVRWRMRGGGLTEGYWLFLGASSLFVLGMFIYVQLYNLYLLDLGFNEEMVGKVSSASTAGTALAILPAAALARRWGLGNMLLVFFGGMAAISAARVLVTTAAPALSLAFLNGVVMALYVVSLAPSIAQLTSDRARATGFSFSTASSIGLGIPANWLWGHLANWMGGKRPVMFAGCALVALALVPAARLKMPPAPAEGAKLYPRSRFVTRFLIVFALWNIGTGLFNPFFATFFARLRVPVERIGTIFSASQLTQVAALLLAPLLLRRFGIVSGTAAMLLATSVAMGALAAGPAGIAVPVVFCCYAAFQWMSDPGINTLLMNRVSEMERGGAAALMMLMSFGAQFVSAWAGGASIARFGYAGVLACGAGLAAIAGFAFRFLPGPDPEPVKPVEPPRLIPVSAPDSAPN